MERLIFNKNKSQSLDKIIIVYLCFTVLFSVIFETGAHGYNFKIKPRTFFHRHHDCVLRLFSGGQMVSSTLDPQGSHYDTITAEFTAFGKHFLLDLRLNRQLFSGAYVQKVFHTTEHSNNKTNVSSHSWIPHSDADHCYYQGHVRHRVGSQAAVSTCDGLSGYIVDRQDSYHIETVQGNVLRVYRGSDQRALPFKCGTEGHDPRLQEIQTVLRRHRRSTHIHAPYDSNELTRYVELYLVSDYSTYKRHGKNSSIVIKRSKEIANIVSSLYRQLNIYVALVGVEVWAGGDRVSVTNSADITMESFLHYRMQKINPIHHNDNAQLITGVFFDHGVVGKAIKGPICTHQFSGGVNMDYGGMVSLVATTVAHEMGHNFGMEHDNDTQCDCIADKCIMAATSGKISPKHWSSCSHNALAEAFHLGMDYCLRNVPETLYGDGVCGNGLKEEGEECDCGLPEDCTSRCCDPHTCKMFPLAKCATGKCCDLTTCQLKPATTSCREAAGECDLPEFCNGKSEFCPQDVFNQDGIECLSGQSYCYRGHCTTHTNQCKLLWGESGRVSDPICFQQLNMNDNKQGSCGYDWTSGRYSRCNKEDVMCGLLHCVHLNEKLMFWRDNLAIDMQATFLTRGNDQFVCRSAMLDVGMDMPNPSFVPDGAKCEHNKICIKQKCVALAKLKVKECPQNCHGRGRCNSEGHCHCQNGYAPPFCNSPGFGGSIDSGPVSNKTGPTVTHRPAVTGSTQDFDHDQESTPKDRNVSVSTNSSESGILGDKDDRVIVLLLVLLLVVPLIALAVLAVCCRARIKPYWNRFMQTFTNWAKCKNRKPKPVPPPNSVVSFEGRSKSNGGRKGGFGSSGRARGPKPPIYRDHQATNPLVHQHDSDKEQNNLSSSRLLQKKEPFNSSSAKDNAPPYRPPPPPSRPPSIVKSKSASKKVRLSTPIQETQGPPPSLKPISSSAKGAPSALPSHVVEDENAKPGKITKRESFRGSEISGPVLVCTTNRNSLVLADGNVDIIGPEAVTGKPCSVSPSIGDQVKRSQSERGAFAPTKPSVTKSASVRAGFEEAASNPASAGGFRSRPVPPLPAEEEDDDTQPIYSNEGSGVGDLLSEIQGSLGDQLYNNLPIQATAPPCPPRPDRHKSSYGNLTPLSQRDFGSRDQDSDGTQSSNPSQKAQTPAGSSIEKTPKKSSQQGNQESTAFSAGGSISNEPKTSFRNLSNNSRPANNETTAKSAADNSSLLKNSVPNELRQKILSRYNVPASSSPQTTNSSTTAQSNARVNTPSTHSTSTTPSSTSKTVTGVPLSSVINPTSSQIKPYLGTSSLTETDTNQPSKHSRGPSANAAVAEEPSSSTPSVSSLKAKFNQTSSGATVNSSAKQKNTPGQPKTGLTKGVASSDITKAKNSLKPAQEKTIGQSKAGSKVTSQKPSGAPRTVTDKKTEPQVSGLKEASGKKPGQASVVSKGLSGKPQEKPGLKPVPSERSKPTASSPEDQPSGSAQRPLLPPKPKETPSSGTMEKNKPKTTAQTPGTSTQPKRVQSFRI